MANVSNYSLRLLNSLKKRGQELAKEEGTTLNQLINVALAEKIATLDAETYFAQRIKNAAGRERALQILWSAGDPDAPVREGDEIPPGFVYPDWAKR